MMKTITNGQCWTAILDVVISFVGRNWSFLLKHVMPSDPSKNCKHLSALWCMKTMVTILKFCIKLTIALGKNADQLRSLFSLSGLSWKERTDISHLSCLQKPNSNYSVVCFNLHVKTDISITCYFTTVSFMISVWNNQIMTLLFMHCQTMFLPKFQSTVDKEVQSHHRLCWISSHHQKTYLPIKAFPANTTDLEQRF